MSGAYFFSLDNKQDRSNTILAYVNCDKFYVCLNDPISTSEPECFLPEFLCMIENM